jgi:glycosyltransferase involved in cell wall biosynthesis
MTLPLISCIVPVFNGEPFLREALDSIFEQTYQAIEVIVIDDGSTDNTAQIVASFGPRLSFRWQPNSGPAAARNLGLDVARGDFFAFLDADDLWHPEKLARQFARFAARPELDLCVTAIQNFWAPEFSSRDPRYQDPRNRRPWPGYGCPTLLARRETFDTVGHFNSKLRQAEDDEWFIRAAERGQIWELVPQALVYRRMHRSNLTLGAESGGFSLRLKLIKESLDRRREGARSRAGAGDDGPCPGTGGLRTAATSARRRHDWE